MISEKGIIWTLYSEIGSRPVMWLWKPYIPLGKVTLLQAESSEIITSFLTGFLSEVSKGGNTPDGNQFGRPYKIIYQSSISKDIIKERLETEDADCNQIGFMDGKQSELLETYLEDLEKALEGSWSRVVVIDTIGAYSTEALLTGLVCLPRLKTLNQMIKLAQKNNCAVILTGLTKKRRKTKSEFEKSIFDMDVLSAARSILQIEQKEDTQNTYTLRQIKNNLAPEGEDIPFLILSSGKIEWLCINNEPEKEQLIRSSDSDAHSEIDELPISTRVVNVLKRAGKDTIEKILAIKDKAAFLHIRNLGEKGYMQVIEALEAREMDVSHLK